MAIQFEQMIGAFYDVEVFANFFSASFLDIATPQSLIDEYIAADIAKDKDRKLEVLSRINHRVFIIHEARNDIKALYDFLSHIKLLIGFNSSHFDDILIDVLLINKNAWYDATADWIYVVVEKLKKITDEIIGFVGSYRYFDEELKRFKSPYTSVDLLSALFETINRKSLKQTGINLKWYRIEDLPLHPDTYVTVLEFDPIIEYNFNDVLITRALYFQEHDEINLKVRISSQFHVNVLSANRSKIADVLLTKLYSEYTGLAYWQYKDKRTYRSHIRFADIINPRITFKTPILQTMHNDLMKYDHIVEKEFNKLILYRDRGYTLARGGLHSVDRPELYFADDNYTYIDADVSSYYPNLVINEGVAPAHVAFAAFQAAARFITTERMVNKTKAKEAKRIKDIALAVYHGTAADAYKIVANSGLFGKLGFDGWMFDLKAMFQTTINGELYLLMLIEELEENGIPVISANTDGVIAKVHKDQRTKYEAICDKWQRMTTLSLEFTEYHAYARTTVNDYLAVKKSWLETKSEDDIKRKGDFVFDINIQKGYNAPVIAMAINNKILYGTPGEETLLNHKNIYDFCISVKTGEAYKKELHTIMNGQHEIETLSKNLRYFVSTNGGTLLKHNATTDSLGNMLKNYKITPFNDYYLADDYHIDYLYYNRRYRDLWYKMIGAYSKPRTSRRPSMRGSRGTTQIGKMFD